jgi:hypothetical protein
MVPWNEPEVKLVARFINRSTVKLPCAQLGQAQLSLTGRHGQIWKFSVRELTCPRSLANRWCARFTSNRVPSSRRESPECHPQLIPTTRRMKVRASLNSLAVSQQDRRPRTLRSSAPLGTGQNPEPVVPLHHRRAKLGK